MGGVRCLGLFPKKIDFFWAPSLMVIRGLRGLRKLRGVMGLREMAVGADVAAIDILLCG